MLFEEYISQEEYLNILNEKLFDFIDTLEPETLTPEQLELLDSLLEVITEFDIEDFEGEDVDEEFIEEWVKKRVVEVERLFAGYSVSLDLRLWGTDVLE